MRFFSALPVCGDRARFSAGCYRANRGLSPFTCPKIERSPVITSAHRFFQIAIWLPFIGLLTILLGDWFYQRYDISTEQAVLIYWLGFGVIAYPAFAIWATRYIKKKPETTVARLIWWAPIIFIPFYGVPWVIYGLAHVVMGDMSGIAMTLLWVAFSPYIIGAGYIFSTTAFVIYTLFFHTASSEH